MVYVKQLALYTSQAMPWVSGVCSARWVLTEEIKVTKDLLINTLIDPPLPDPLPSSQSILPEFLSLPALPTL